MKVMILWVSRAVRLTVYVMVIYDDRGFLSRMLLTDGRGC